MSVLLEGRIGGEWQGVPMIDHISLQTDDLSAAVAWYDDVLAPLGVSRLLDFEGVAGYGPTDGFPSFWLGAATDPGGRQAHIAFTAVDRAAVRAVHQVAIGLGGEVLHEPREWPEYHPGYYAVFLRDPDGNNVEAVCHSPGE
jgi:catechol 2,3-dioxygenase-like lactoylglutathione lyase family enzyme